MKPKLSLLMPVLVAFSVWTFGIVLDHGYTGFLSLAAAEPWAAQLLVDLVIALSLFLTWMLRDAKSHGIVAWPYLLMTLTLGSIGALAYLVHRTLKANPAAEPVGA